MVEWSRGSSIRTALSDSPDPADSTTRAAAHPHATISTADANTTARSAANSASADSNPHAGTHADPHAGTHANTDSNSEDCAGVRACLTSQRVQMPLTAHVPIPSATMT